MTFDRWLASRQAAWSAKALGAALVAGMLSVAAAPVCAEDPNQWVAIKGEDGKPVPNLRLPVELTSELEALPGVVWVGSDNPDVTLIEVYDYNCPWCHKASQDLDAMLKANPDLRVGFVNNPILSPGSAQAAKVELALLRLKGAKVAYAFNRKLYARKGRIDGNAALDVAAAMGFTRAEIEAAANAPEIQQALAAQMKLAASLGLAATPSFIGAGVGILGWPGRKALDVAVASMRECDQLVCN